MRILRRDGHAVSIHGGALQERIEERGRVGLSDRAEVHRLLAEAGFSLEREFSDYQFTAYQDGDPLLVVEASRVK